MYLLVVVTLVIGLLSIYAQVLSLQAARIAEGQTGLANTMLMWHAAAVSMGASIVDSGLFPDGTTPCSLTYGTALAACTPPTSTINGTVTGGPTGYSPSSICTSNCGPAAVGAPVTEPVHLPPNYATALYQFYSVLYRDTSGATPSNQPFVVTYVAPPVLSASNPAPGYLSLPPTYNLISLTSNDLLRQFSVLGVPDYAWGKAKSGVGSSVLVTRNYMSFGSKSFQYNLPLNGTSAILDTGAVAIVSTTAGF
jgi:hypothetical protein